METFTDPTLALGIATGLIVATATIYSRLFREVGLAFVAAGICAVYLDGGAKELAGVTYSFAQHAAGSTSFCSGFVLGVIVAIVAARIVANASHKES